MKKMLLYWQEIQIIEKKERPKNGFVLSEKTDLENTEAFKK